MKVLPRFQALALALLAFCCATMPGRAQPVFGLGVTSSHTSIAVNNPLTYTITLTNLTGSVPLNVGVTNTFSGPVAVQNFSIVPATGTFFTDAQTNQVFFFGSVLPTSLNVMTLTVAPLAAGSLTNNVTVGTTSSPLTTNASVVVLVTNVPLPEADLAVSMIGPPGPVLVDDWFTFGITVRNPGSNSVSGVVLTNIASPIADLFLIDFSPTNPPPTFDTNDFLLFDVGTLTNGAVRNFSVTVLRTNTGTLTFSALVGAAGFAEANTNNNFVSTNITIEPLVTGQLTASNASAMTFNPQNSLMQQTIRLVNTSTSTVPSARVIITGLGPTNWLFNAVGTNMLGSLTNLNPYVVYPAPLDPLQSVDLVLQYGTAHRRFFYVDNTNYVAVSTGPVNLSVPAFPISALTNFFLPDGSMLIQFNATTGLTYQVQYSSDVTFSTNVFLAQPPIVASANIVQWIDNGPPNTVSPPMSVPMRFYRVQIKP